MGQLIIGTHHWQAMVEHVERCLPEEGCGLIAGVDDQIIQIYPVTNQDHSSLRFRMDPQEQVEALEDIEANQRELLAIYHSHPQGPSHPSQQDLAEFTCPGCLYLIWYRSDDQWDCRAYAIEGNISREVHLIQEE